jgi:hypothetical protein
LKKKGFWKFEFERNQQIVPSKGRVVVFNNAVLAKLLKVIEDEAIWNDLAQRNTYKIRLLK